MKKIAGYSFGSLLALSPVLVFAQSDFGEVDTFVQSLSGFINSTLIPILLAVAFVVFIWGIVQYFLLAGQDNSDAQSKGKMLMLYGIIGFVLIVSIWGIVQLLTEGLNLQGNEGLDRNQIPAAPTTGS